MRIFLSKQQLPPGRGRVCLFPQFQLGLLELPFSSRIVLAPGVPLSLPSSKALLPHAASEEAMTALPEFLLAPFIKSPNKQDSFWERKLVKKCQV